MSACKRHATEPVRGYADCPGCEIERLVRGRHDAQRDRDAARAEARELRESRDDWRDRYAQSQIETLELQAELALLGEAGHIMARKLDEHGIPLDASAAALSTAQQEECPDCDGDGVVSNHRYPNVGAIFRCQRCYGEGVITKPVKPAEQPDPYNHEGKGGVWNPLMGPCICRVCEHERTPTAEPAQREGE